MKIAIVGSGISGLSAAYLLDGMHDVTIFEKSRHFGGHTRTVLIRPEGASEDIPVDTGFIVFNYRNYPLLAQLFAELNVPVQKSDMSFGLTVDEGWLEYGTPKFWNVFAQKRNLARPAYWRMMSDVVRFFRQSPNFLTRETDFTLGDCLDELSMGAWFRRYFLVPMGSAIWSCPPETMMEFPAATFIRFFKNHGLLTLSNQPQWYTVTGGAREYVRRLKDAFSGCIRPSGAVRIERPATEVGQCFVTAEDGSRNAFDKVVLACHADQALALLDTPTEREREILSVFKFQKNRTVLHGDPSFMPRRRNAWSSWAYIMEHRNRNTPDVTMSYWMNRLQSLDYRFPLFETLNPIRSADPELVYDEFEFEHPIFDKAAIDAQGLIQEIQGMRGTWYCGAWQRYGFHEDGVWSALRVASGLGTSPNWTV
ncbi:MAG: hypothetical protein CFH41_01146 [Alphaproteobacteria bacterium MarineAlpha11_Bin1]|nr:MAG: hypothetical protein CFH41_01146 [Alphaproteobacteria bacterium MarineAlpha11_Bin1]|tara:strand:- start:6446 stop:7717 length:1272 start_codon:yes stop_codon:yes gene_type:complete